MAGTKVVSLLGVASVLALSVAPAACSDDPLAASNVVPDAGPIVDVAPAPDAGSMPADSGPVDAACTCADEDPETVDFCPPSPSCAYLTFHETSRTELRGQTGDSSELAMCPRPSVLVGINATASGPIQRVSPVCGTPRVTTRPSLAIDFGQTSMPLGAVEGGTTSVCPTVLTGFSGRSVGIGQDRIAQFVGRCASVSIASSGANEVKVAASLSADRFTVGPDGADALLAVTDCPSGSVATGMRLRKSGDDVVAIGLVCGEPWLWYE